VRTHDLGIRRRDITIYGKIERPMVIYVALNDDFGTTLLPIFPVQGFP
jgi:hypothetical protein